MNKQQLDILLAKYNLTPNKIRGQNFLISDEVLEDIIEAAQIKKDDLVIEVGPGPGALTKELVKKAGQLVAFEVDKNFARPLAEIADREGNLELIWQDILSLNNDKLDDILAKHNRNTYKIVANIPYYLTSKFIQKFITMKRKPDSMTLMIQKEVAERIVVKDKKQSLLSLSVAFYAQSRVVRLVTKENFYPAPKVDSAIIHIDGLKPWEYKADEKKTWRLIKMGFASKRKKLINNLSADSKLDKEKISATFHDLNFDINVRAEKLSRQDWLNLSEKL